MRWWSSPRRRRRSPAAWRSPKWRGPSTSCPTEQREALLLVVLEGMSYAEAARILGIPDGTLMSRLSRARAALRGMTGFNEEPRLRTVK